MRKVETIYKEAAPKYLELAKQADENREAILKVRDSRELTYEGKQKRIDFLHEKGNTLKAEIAAVVATANEQAQEVRRKVEQHFYNYFNTVPEDVDMHGLELLKSGILSDSELIRIAEGYKGNATMQKIYGKHMLQSNSSDVRRVGSVLLANSTNPHLRCIDSIIEVGKYCLGGGTTHGASCEVFLRRFDEMTAQVYAAAPDIEA